MIIYSAKPLVYIFIFVVHQLKAKSVKWKRISNSRQLVLEATLRAFTSSILFIIREINLGHPAEVKSVYSCYLMRYQRGSLSRKRDRKQESRKPFLVRFSRSRKGDKTFMTETSTLKANVAVIIDHENPTPIRQQTFSRFMTLMTPSWLGGGGRTAKITVNV